MKLKSIFLNKENTERTLNVFDIYRSGTCVCQPAAWEPLVAVFFTDVSDGEYRRAKEGLKLFV